MSISADLTPPAVPIVTDHRLATPALPKAPPPDGTGSRAATDAHHGVFTAATCHDDLVHAYPDLAPVCTRLGFAGGMTLAQWCSSPEWMLLILARASQPPQPSTRLDWANTSIAAIIEHLLVCHHRTMRNELSRLAVLIRDITHRHGDAAAIRFGHDFRRFEADSLVRLDFAELAVFPSCLVVATRSDPDTGGKATIDIAVRLHAMMVNNDQAALELGSLLRQVSLLMHRHTDPDLLVVKAGLAVLALELAAHATTERNLLAAEVLFADELHQAQRDPSYCINGAGEWFDR